MHFEPSDFHDQFVRGLTHRMNNILSLFHGYLGLLLENEKLDRTTLEGLEQIKAGARAASELMDRTNALARPASVIWREINLNDLMTSMQSLLQSNLEGGVRLKIHCAEDLPPVWADASRLKTAIIELVRNAGEASPVDGKVTVEVSCDSAGAAVGPSSAAQRITWVSIAVTDEGGGVPEELLEKIFDPFFSTKHDHNSTGLGLTVALGLVQQLGGVIRLDSQPGRTAFRMLLPARSERF